MAQSLRRPFFSAVCLPPSTFRVEQRAFSQHVCRWAMAEPKVARPVNPPERSIRLLSREGTTLPSDIGLLQDTFVTPSGSNRPSLFQNPRGLLKLQWYRLKYRLRDQFSALVLKWSSPKDRRWFHRTIKLQRSQIVPTAVALHERMYAAFAEGDSQTLRKICTDGIYDSFRARIAARGRGEKTQWELLKYNKRAKLVSNRAARLPIDGAAVRQAVVRIASRQRLTRYYANGTVIPGTGREKDVVEYVVLQKKYSQWKGEEWQVWGTTDETTLEQVEEVKMRAMN